MYRILGDEIFASCMLRRTSPLKTISVWHRRPLPIGILAMLKKATPLKRISDSQSPFQIYTLLPRRGQCVMIYIVSHLILHFLILDETHVSFSVAPIRLCRLGLRSVFHNCRLTTPARSAAPYTTIIRGTVDQCSSLYSWLLQSRFCLRCISVSEC